MSLKSMIEKCIALVTGKGDEGEQLQEESQNQNFEENVVEENYSEEGYEVEEPEESFEELCEEVSYAAGSYELDLGEPAEQEKECYSTKHEEESWSVQEENSSMQNSEAVVEHASEQVHNPEMFHEEDLH